MSSERASTTSSEIRWPPNWVAATRSAATYAAFAALFFALISLLGVWLLRVDGLLWAIPAFLVALLLLPPALVNLVFVTPIRKRGWSDAYFLQLRQSGRRVAKLPMSRFSAYGFLWMCVIALLLFWTFPILDFATPYDPSYARMRLHTWAWLGPVISVFPLSYLGSRLIRRHKEMGIALSPDGVYHWSWFGGCFWAWEWIQGVRAVNVKRTLFVDLVLDEPAQHDWDPEENFAAKLNHYRKRLSRLPVAALVSNPAVPLYAIEFYRRHPELRHELGTQAGVDRIRRGDLPDVIEEVRAHGRFQRS